MYEDLKSRLEQLVKMEPHDNGMGIFLISAEGVNAIRGCAAEAADAIEAMNMRLLGDNAAIAGMKREIERMVTESSLRVDLRNGKIYAIERPSTTGGGDAL